MTKAANRRHARSVRPHSLRGLTAFAILIFAWPFTAHAHDFGLGGNAYEDFLSGCQSVLFDVPVVLAVIATGLLAGIWRERSLPLIWLAYLLGAIGGLALGISGILPPVLPALIFIMLAGILGAAALDLSVNQMRMVLFASGLLSANTVLSGHSAAEIPLLSWFGIVFALNIVLAITAGLVTISREKLAYGWVMIGWRAGSSWIVAVAIIMVALVMTSKPGI